MTCEVCGVPASVVICGSPLCADCARDDGVFNAVAAGTYEDETRRQRRKVRFRPARTRTRLAVRIVPARAGSEWLSPRGFMVLARARRVILGAIACLACSSPHFTSSGSPELDAGPDVMQGEGGAPGDAGSTLLAGASGAPLEAGSSGSAGSAGAPVAGVGGAAGAPSVAGESGEGGSADEPSPPECGAPCVLGERQCTGEGKIQECQAGDAGCPVWVFVMVGTPCQRF